jgi:hypothetical protein
VKPGWYPDPDHPGQMRWWDGSRWSAQAAAVGPPHESTPDSFAIAAFVTGLLGVPLAPIYLGLRARTRILNSGGTRDGMGLAMAGLVLGLLEAGALVVLVLVGIAA